MGSFRHTWDDFSGGYYVGQLDNKQPYNTYTGYNVATAVTDGAVVAVDTPRPVKFWNSTSPSWITASGTIRVGVNGPAWVSSPVMCNNTSVFSSIEWDSTASNYKAYVYVIVCTDIISGPNTVTVYRSAAINPAIGTNNVACISTDPVCVPLSDSSFDIYASFFTNIVYRFRVTSLPTASIAAGVAITTNVPAAGRIVDLTLWGSRMIATVLSSDTIYFSDVASSQIYSSWSSLNFIAPGASSDVVLNVIPRQDELWVLKPTGVYVITGVLGSSSFVRRYKSVSAPNPQWTRSVAEYANQIYMIPNEPPGRLLQIIGNREIANYSYFADLSSTAPKIYNGFLSYFNLGTSYPTVVTTQNDHLALSYIDNINLISPSGLSGATNVNIFTLDSQNNWTRRLFPIRNDVVATTGKSYTFVCAKTNSYLDDFSYSYPTSTYTPTRYNRTFIYYFQLTRSSFNAIEVSFSFFSILPNAAGFNFITATAYSDFSSGVLTTSQIQTEKPTKITRVYVEAEFNPYLSNFESQGIPSGSSPTLSVVVNNLAVDDMNFDITKTYSSTPKTYTGPTVGTFGVTNNQTRIIRFDPNDTGYGYKHNVSITIKGFRIKNVWVEGETR